MLVAIQFIIKYAIGTDYKELPESAFVWGRPSPTFLSTAGGPASRIDTHRHQPFQPDKPLTKNSNHYLSEILHDFTLRWPFSKLHVGGQKMTTLRTNRTVFVRPIESFFSIIISHSPGNIQLIHIRRNRSGEHVPGNHLCLLYFFSRGFS